MDTSVRYNSSDISASTAPPLKEPSMKKMAKRLTFHLNQLHSPLSEPLQVAATPNLSTPSSRSRRVDEYGYEG